MSTDYDRHVLGPSAAEAATLLRGSPCADLIRAARLIVVLRRVEPQEHLLELVAELADDGVKVFEITLDSVTAIDDLRACRALLVERGHSAAIVGAGTVRTAEALDAARQAGAAFAVSPTLDTALTALSVACGLPFISGTYSPTEADAAWRAGATFVKLFPASSLGPTHVRELRGPFPEIQCVATGGIDAANAKAFLDAGCVAVGAGRAIVRASRAGRRAMIAAVAGET
jgi:2-dehydro-3-deoxyphosphogluconate aldolase / (4S)-4-hydroxy-2-oxoglutarate aldolase